MNRKLVSVFDCKNGDMLAHDITNEDGTKIVVRDTVINPYIQERLIELGIREIYVYDGIADKHQKPEFVQFRKEYGEGLSGMKDVVSELSAGNKLNVQKLNKVSQFINSRIQQADSVLQCLTSIKSADEYTYTHSLNTAFYSMLIGKWMKLTPSEIENLVQAGLLHDVGKIKISADILNKNTVLKKEEYDEIQKHTTWGYEMLQECSEIDEDVRLVALLHHERIDRSGYPYQAGAPFISIYARIAAVADVYDAMTTERVYKQKLTPFDAFEMFNTVGMTMFDPMVVRTFLKNIFTYFVGADVVLNNGDTGKIVFIPPFDVLPIIKVNSKLIDLSKEKSLRITSVG